MQPDEPVTFDSRAEALARALMEHGVDDAVAQALAYDIGAELGWNVRVAGVRLGQFVISDDDARLAPIVAKLATPQALTAILQRIPILGDSAGMTTAAATAAVLLYRAYKRGAWISEDEARVLTAIERARLARTAIPKPSTEEITAWIRTLFGISASIDEVDSVLHGLVSRVCNDGRARALVERHDGTPVRWTTSIASWF